MHALWCTKKTIWTIGARPIGFFWTEVDMVHLEISIIHFNYFDFRWRFIHPVYEAGQKRRNLSPLHAKNAWSQSWALHRWYYKYQFLSWCRQLGLLLCIDICFHFCFCYLLCNKWINQLLHWFIYFHSNALTKLASLQKSMQIFNDFVFLEFCSLELISVSLLLATGSRLICAYNSRWKCRQEKSLGCRGHFLCRPSIRLCPNQMR